MRPIEKNIPIPAKQQTSPGKRGKYPWHLMEVGDSFTTDASLGTIEALSKYQARKRGFDFECRQIDAVTIRVWRVL